MENLSVHGPVMSFEATFGELANAELVNANGEVVSSDDTARDAS